ncbi:MAG: hypothetical protein KAK00_10985 [Nanoarchaeota archaeon]|nr:hypothetical protein [Nanoarchaeota archaeon]
MNRVLRDGWAGLCDILDFTTHPPEARIYKGRLKIRPEEYGIPNKEIIRLPRAQIIFTPMGGQSKK